ncbi:S-layer homology domain-containing protein [Tumebacillus sp. ITR2]|uniref:S-layer homology domain-containing protein n=1 Tax=Tumebacillus amylolyticus TaxID=2801339 RepID=A0ABS1JF05_9BACL|nr:S-layer homology domain-containing protein [Tumebacillus amylolyticus]MBL0388861.1 S-layer homology domain-containing protein [Tumebacillus amylolyticus]
MFERYELQPMNDGSFTIVLHLKRDLEEFAAEPGERNEGKRRQELEKGVREYVRERFPNSKVTRAKVMLGTALVAAIPLVGAAAAPAAFATGTDTGVASGSTADTQGATPGTTTATAGNATGDTGTTTTGGAVGQNTTDTSTTSETTGTETGTTTGGTTGTETGTTTGTETGTTTGGTTGTDTGTTTGTETGTTTGGTTGTDTGTTTGTDTGTTTGGTTGTDTGTTTGTVTGRTLTDLEGSYASKEIGELVSAGILTGYEDNTFRPNAEMTREEFATGLAKAAGLTIDMDAKSTFTDVSDWAQPYVAAVEKAGLMKGEETNSFGGRHEVTREQMATIFMRALGQPDLATTYATKNSTFVDNEDIADYAKPNIAMAQQLGFVVGNPAGDGAFKFEPTAHAERQAVALLLHKFYTNHTALAAQAADLVKAANTPGTTTGDTTTPGTTTGTDTGTVPAADTTTPATTGPDTGTAPAADTTTPATTGPDTGTAPAADTTTPATTGPDTGTAPAADTTTPATTGPDTGTAPAADTTTPATAGPDTGTVPAADTTTGT